jgi:hypothetical protein
MDPDEACWEFERGVAQLAQVLAGARSTGNYTPLCAAAIPGLQAATQAVYQLYMEHLADADHAAREAEEDALELGEE